MLSRTIKTNYWEDEKIELLGKWATYLLIYLITNHSIGHTGIFPLSDRTMTFRTKLTDTELSEAKQELEKMKRAFFFAGWVFVINAQKHKMYSGPKNEVASNRELDEVPEEVKKHFHSLSTSYPQYYKHVSKDDK